MHKSYKKWLDDGKPKVFCACGCGKEIIIKEHNKRYGIPKYLKGHYIRSNETKQKNSNNNVGFSGRSHTQEYKQKMHDIRIKDNNPFFGKEHTKEYKQNMHEQNTLDKNPNWKGGKSFDPYCEKFNERKKEEVRNQYGRKCYICGKDEKNNITKTKRQFKLSVHHIDEDKEQGCNGKPWKLVPLCIHCHNSKKTKVLKI